ncbi:response regulator transcription factor [Aureispira anguillae]|uniref:Response regulator transcription factor n=1 Tax=Aureispira anguillae TaxID=2864201 RepID=A0A915YDU7_9BACT|nr:response regulator transcription factor [Aureispira anguillae]BDS11242.1 response regulator transcription factor [Aureispira anguillae]
MIKILLVEDNKELRQNTLDFLTQEAYIIEVAENYKTAHQKLQQHRYDILLLDLMLPDGNGIELLRQHIKSKQSSGVLIISAKGALNDRIEGLDLGADDYLPKPFHLSELNARIKAIYRRKMQQGQQEISFGQLRIDTQAQKVYAKNKELVLTKKEYALLIYFVNNRDRMLSKQAIAEHVWGDYVHDLLNCDFVYQHIKNLRKKLAKEIGEDYIQTVYGVGYKMKKTPNIT